MELDKRIIEGKKPLDCFDTENSEVLKPFLQKEGYFSNNLRNFLNLNSCKKGCLVNVFAKNFDCFVCFADDSNSSYKFFIPEAWVKPEEPEKKYRPYTMNEFKAEFKIGMVLTLRNRDTPDYVCQVMYLGNRQYDESDSDNNTIFLSQRFFSLRELFNMFEIVRNGEWQPFGVLDE